MAELTTSDFIGTALQLPIQIDETGKPTYISGEANIKQAIKDILLSPRGVRFFLGQYGSDLHLLLHKPMPIVQALLKIVIARALKQEKRIEFTDFSFTSEVEKITCYINYRILRTNKTDTLVLPFFTQIPN